MRLLVTGGCGFLGSNLAAHYLRAGAQVTIIDALFRTGGAANLDWLRAQAPNNQPEFHRIDLADEFAVNAVLARSSPFDYVCHLGGQVAMTTSLEDPRRDLLTNVVGTFNVLEAVRRHSPEALVAYSSTNKVYGDLRHLTYLEGDTRYTVAEYPHGFDESLPLDFASPYGCSKGAADQYVRDWFRNFGLQTVVFRHSSIYGGRQFSTFDQGWIGWFCRQALEQADARIRGIAIKPFTVQGTGKQVRDVLHAEDLIRLYVLAFEQRESAGGEIFNIGGGMQNSLSLLELFGLLEQLLQFAAPLEFTRLDRRQSDQDVFVSHIGKARRLLGWEPRVTKEDGVGRMLEWSRHQAIASLSSTHMIR